MDANFRIESVRISVKHQMEFSAKEGLTQDAGFGEVEHKVNHKNTFGITTQGQEKHGDAAAHKAQKQHHANEEKARRSSISLLAAKAQLNRRPPFQSRTRPPRGPLPRILWVERTHSRQMYDIFSREYACIRSWLPTRVIFLVCFCARSTHTRARAQHQSVWDTPTHAVRLDRSHQQFLLCNIFQVTNAVTNCS